jgi:hypothetical protein
VENYIDDVIVKSKNIQDHLSDLGEVLERTRKYGLKMNLHKCVFLMYRWVSSYAFWCMKGGLRSMKEALN